MRLPIWLFLTLLLFLSASGVALAQSPAVVIALTPGGAQPATLPLTVAPELAGASTILYLYAPKPIAAPDTITPTVPVTALVRLNVPLTDEQGVPRNEVGVVFTAHVPDGQGGVKTVDATTTSVLLVAGETVVRVDMSVTNVNVNGVLSGTIMAQVNNAFEAGPQLVITRLPKPALAITGAGSGGLSIGDQQASAFNSTFSIESQNRTPTNLTVLVDPFVGPDGAPVTPGFTVDGQAPVAGMFFPGLASKTVNITATLPQTGGYNSAITLVYNNERHSTKLQVTRTRVAPPVTIQDIQTVKGELGPGATNGAQVNFVLVPASGKAVTLDPPAFTLNLVGADKSQTQGKFGGFRLMDASGKVMTGTLPVGSAPVQLRLDVQNIQEAGEYEGTLRIGGGDYQPMEQKVKVLIRENGWVAAFYILLGIVVSAILRVLVKLVRPRLAAQLKLRTVLEELEAQSEALKDDLNAQERNVLNGLARQLARQSDLAVSGQDQNTDALITKIRALMPLFVAWVNARLRVDALEPVSLQDQFRPSLKAIGKQLLEVGADGVAALKTTVDGLDPAIDKAIKDEVKKQIDAFTTVFQSFPAPPAGAPMSSLHQRVQNELKAANDELGKEHFDAARLAYRNGRRAYIELLIAELDGKLSGPEPMGFDTGGWADLGVSVRAKLASASGQLAGDLDKAASGFDAAYQEYLGAVTDKLRATALETKQDLETNKPAPTASNYTQWQGWSNDVATALDQLDAAQKGLAALKPDLSAIWKAYDAARVKTETVLSQMAKAKGAGVLAVTPGAAGIGRGLFGGAPPTAASQKPSATLDQILLSTPDTVSLAKRVLLNEAVLSFVVFCIAVVVGMKLLWMDVATWGGWGSYVAAFMWGLGLQQVAGQGFEGWTGLRTQLESKNQ